MGNKIWDEVCKVNVFLHLNKILEDIIRIINQWEQRRVLEEMWGDSRDSQLDYAQSLNSLAGTLHEIRGRGKGMSIEAGRTCRKFFSIDGKYLERECHTKLGKLWMWLKKLESSSEYPLIKQEEGEKEKTLKWIDELDASLINEYLLRRTTRQSLVVEMGAYQEPIEMRVHISAH